MKNIIHPRENFKVKEEYILSNFDENVLIKSDFSQEEIDKLTIFCSHKIKEMKEEKIIPFPKDFLNIHLAAEIYANEIFDDDKNIEILSRVAAFLQSEVLLVTFYKYFNKGCIRRGTNKKEEKLIDNNISILAYGMLSFVDIRYLVNTLFPYLYSDDEIDILEKKLSESYDKNDGYDEIINILNDFFKNYRTRIQYEYTNIREFVHEFQKAYVENNIEFQIEINCTCLEKTEYAYSQIKRSIYIVNYFQKEYDNEWKYSNHIYKSIFCFTNRKYYYFYLYDMYVTGNYLKYFFEILNEHNEFDINQIEYILEMAPKLRIASYLNKEYANYKKLFNPDARDFDFGEDEAEEATFETLTSKDHLEPLPHFEDEKLKKLLNILIDAEYIDENTRDRDWLFALGMSGDKKPKDFKKIQWIGGSKTKGISPSYFIDFIGILGYDLNKIYEDKVQIIILNQCFKTTKVDIQQKNIKKNKKFIVTPKHEEMTKLVKKAQLLPG